MNLQGSFPLVLHRIVTGTSDVWDDVRLEFLESLLGYAIHDPEDVYDLSFLLNGNRSILTFDDGNSSDFTHVYPLLQNYGFKAIFFIITDCIGKDDFLSRDNISEMSSNGMIFGSHSHTHIPLTKLSLRQLKYELSKSKAILEDLLHKEIDILSYPFGDFNVFVQNVALDCGYKYIFTSQSGFVKNNDRICRNSIHSKTDLAKFIYSIDPSCSSYIRRVSFESSKNALKFILSDSNYKNLRKLFSKFL